MIESYKKMCHNGTNSAKAVFPLRLATPNSYPNGQASEKFFGTRKQK